MSEHKAVSPAVAHAAPEYRIPSRSVAPGALLTVLLATCLGAAVDATAVGAQAREPQLRIGMRADTVFVYHTGLTPLGGGILVDRDTGHGWQRLTERPTLAARGPDEFVMLLGDLYPEVELAMERQDPTGTFYGVRSDPMAANLLTFRYRKLALALGRLYLDTDVPPVGRARYRVTLVDGAEVPIGAPIEGDAVLEPLVPAAPTEFSARHTAEQLLLRWRYPGLARGQDDGVTAFTIFEGEPDGEPLNRHPILRSGNVTEYVYRYDITADDQVLELYLSAMAFTGELSDPVLLRYTLQDHFPPRPVMDVRATDMGGRVEVVWPGRSPDQVAGYHVYRTQQTESGFLRLTEEPLPGDATVYVDETATSGRFFYQVTVLDSKGNESEPGQGVMVLVRDVTPPDPPTELTGEYLPEEDAVILRWVDSEPAPDLRTYLLTRRRADRLHGGAWGQVNFDDTRNLEWLDRGPGDRGFEQGIHYAYQLTAMDSARNMSEAAELTLQIPKLRPPTPPGQVRAANDRGFRHIIHWNASPDGDVVRYAVYRRAEGTSEPEEVARLPAHVRSYRDEAVASGDRFVYLVAAVDSLGNEGPVAASELVALRPENPPRPPRNARAAASADGGVQLTWEPVPGDVSGYRILRSATAAGRYQAVQKELVAGTTWTDPGGAAGMWYRVVAVDRAGNESRPGEAVQAAAPRPRGGGR